jgi:hypothetical protein
MKNNNQTINNMIVPHPRGQRVTDTQTGKRASLALGVLILICGLHPVVGQGTAFTYQGQLQEGGAAANGLYDFTFWLYNVSSGGTAVAGPVTNAATSVNDGFFAAIVDFGAGVFDGTSYWLQIGVRTNGIGAFSTLSPRQELTPAPYAMFAEKVSAAGLGGTIPSASLAGVYGSVVNFTNPADSFFGNGTGLTNVNAARLDGMAASSFWNITGNAGTSPGVNFLGTTDNEPLNFRANNEVGLQVQYWQTGNIVIDNFNYGINIIGGYWGNTTSNNAIGATIAGGGYLNKFGILPPTTVGYPNVVTGDFGTVGGGWGNTAGADATVPGGSFNIAGGSGSFAAGQFAQTHLDGCFVWGDGSQNPFTGAQINNSFSVLASGGVFFYNGTNGVYIDRLEHNDGTIYSGLRFGNTSGEGIGSKRTHGGNQNGLDFYTAYNNRMCIDNNGHVGINTTTPSQRLEVNGNFVLVDGGGNEEAYIGGDGAGQDVQVGSMSSSITNVTFWNTANNAYMHIGCSSITIHGGADLAEPFQIAGGGGQIQPGAVMVIDDQNPGQLRLSDRPYDTRVAGIVSGARGIHPGVQLQQEGLLEGGRNVALTGRVYAQADASNGAIHPGDLLTTSDIPGYAMKVTDHARAQGAILGKAMTGLDKDQGMVLVLVTLQ